MLPTPQNHNADCLQAHTQELKKVRREPPSGPESNNYNKAWTKESRQSPKIDIESNHSEAKPTIRKHGNLQVQDESTAESAKKAAALAGELMEDPQKAKALILRMTINQKASKVAPNTWPPRNTIIPTGFKWAKYPPLEAEREEDYHQLESKSLQQRNFISHLVCLVNECATEHGLEFDSCFSDDTILRTRICNHYKNRKQNAKKRLATIIDNPTKPVNVKRLCALLEIMEQLQGSLEQDKKPAASPKVADQERSLEPETALPSRAALRSSIRKAKPIITLCEAGLIL